MTHGEKRELFTRCLALLLTRMILQGYNPRLNWVKRPASFDDRGWEGSLHPWGLAADIDLFDNMGKYLETTAAHKEFGLFWESLHELCTWGGRFDDGNHYSVTHNGIK